MSVLETSNEDGFIDDTCQLSCEFQNFRIVDDHHTEYIMKVYQGFAKEKCWTVVKRYSEFAALHKELQCDAFGIDLPPKKIIGNLNKQFIGERLQNLQKYMNKILDKLVLSVSLPLRRFLDPNSYPTQLETDAFEHASMALRGHAEFYEVRRTSAIGWRARKHYYAVKRRGSKYDYHLAWIREPGVDRCLDERETQSALRALLELSHPYILLILIGHYYSSGTLIIRSSCFKGSLRDLIYDKSPTDSYLTKCQYPNDRLLLASDVVSTISFQILSGLKYLHDRGIPYGNLHCGNVFIDDNVAKISDIENGVFGLPSFYRPYVAENRRIHTVEDVDVYCFGHVLYEMSFGRRLECYCCDNIPTDCYDHIRSILELILSNLPKKPMPRISALLESNAFKFCSSNSSYNFSSSGKLNSHAKELFRKCKMKIESRIHQDQTKLKKFRKMARLQELIDVEEQSDICASHANHRKSKYKVKKTTSEISLGTSPISNPETISNDSTPTSSTGSSTPSSGYDRPNVVKADDKVDSQTRSSYKNGTDDRSVFLQSICAFNKNNLRKAKTETGIS